jgi:hypothetical protein
LVGSTGRGKTIAASSWPGKTLILDLDGRHRSIIQWNPERVKAGDYVVEEVTVENYMSTFVPLVDSLATYNPYTNVILDGLTSLSTTTVMLQMKARGKVQIFDPKAAKPEGLKLTTSGIAVPSWDEFNGEAMLIARLIESLRSLKCNLFLTAHPLQRMTIGENKKPTKYTSLCAFGPKIESMVPPYFDEVWYFDYQVESTNDGKSFIKRTCYFQPCEDYFEAKTAMKLPASVDYTNKNLYDCVKPYLVEVAEPVL